MSEKGVDYHYKKIEDFSKMTIHIPPNFDEMLIVLRGFCGLTKIVFGDNNILAKQLMIGIEAIENDRSRLRANMATDVTLIAKLLYKIDMHVQRWMELNKDVEDREFVDDVGVLCFDNIVNDAIMGNLHSSLPRVIQDLLTVDDDNNEEGTKRKRKNDKNNNRNNNNNKSDNDEVVVNNDQIIEFKLGPNEQYSKIISGKGVRERVKWDETTMMCVRWHIGGRCVKHCKHAASHVPANCVPNEKKTDMMTFVRKMRALAM
jgi:hypothetical protein